MVKKLIVDCIYSLAAVYAKCGVMFIEVTFFFFETFSQDMYQISLKIDGIKNCQQMFKIEFYFCDT